MTAQAATVAAYVLVVVAAGAIEVVARVRPEVLPTFGRVLTWALRRRSTQLFVVFTWWWLGWHFTTNR